MPDTNEEKVVNQFEKETTDDVDTAESNEPEADDLEISEDDLLAATDEEETHEGETVKEPEPEPEPKAEKKGLFGKKSNKAKKEKKSKEKKEKKEKKAKAPKQKKPKKKSLMSYVNLKNEIESHGFKFSFKNFIFQAFLYVAATILIAVISKMNIVGIVFLVIMALFATPYIIKSQFDQMYQINRFQMVVNYLDNVIPIFKNTPIIAKAWSDVLDLTDGKMHELLEQAIQYLRTNTEDVTPELTAFQIIEKEFPNSRIHSVHQMMYTIVRQNSKSYQQSVDNMYYDVQGWISRTYNFQKDLKQRRTKMMLLCLLTMGCNCMFIAMYSTTDMFAGFTAGTAYQISTFFFIAVMLAMMCAIMIKMNGAWLIDDKVDTQASAYEKAFKRAVIDPKPNPTVPQLIMSAVCGALGAYLFMQTKQIVVLLMMLFVAFMFAYQNRNRYNLAKKKIERAMEIEFPVWLRDVALNLQNMTVINSIENSRSTVSSVFAYYIDIFMNQIKENPTSIKPFNDFLNVCDLPDIKASMKVLFTLQTLKDDQVMEQTNSLIVRNQSMLAKSEQLKNEDSIGAIESLGFLPIAMFSIQMLVSMALMFSYMMTYMTNAMSAL